MRVLAVANRYPPWSSGGYEAIAAAAVGALRSSGHDVRVLSTIPDRSDQEPAEPPDPDVHRELLWYWRDHRFPSIGLRRTVALERANARVLKRHLRAFEPDVVLWWAMGGMSLSLLEQVRQAGTPSIGVVGDDWMLYGPEVDAWTRRWRGKRAPGAPIAQRLTGIPASLKLSDAARWVFISHHLRSGAQAAGLEVADAAVAHPGVDPGRFRRRDAGAWRWRLLYCGRIDSRKGIVTAIEALALLAPDATLTIDGPGPPSYVSELTELAARLGASSRTQFRCSSQAEVPAAYAAADAVVFPVKWQEPWGLVPLEAMATGRPVLASRAGGGAAEYLRDGTNCLQFSPGDAEALAAAITRLAADAKLRERLIAGGLDTAARFTDRAFHDALELELERAVYLAGTPRT
jgi:glycosyltransferase involved in cell wall biosynthesis